MISWAALLVMQERSAGLGLMDLIVELECKAKSSVSGQGGIGRGSLGLA